VKKNVVIPIELMHSSKKYYGGHGFGYGGGDIKNHVKFNYSDIEYLHEIPYILVVVKLYKGDFYLVYYDRVTDIHNTTYKFYKSTEKGDFKEIEASKFPKHLAIQNRFWDNDVLENSRDLKRLKGLNPEKILGSTTAKIWYTMDDKPKTFDSMIEFIKDYKEKYITNKKEEE